MPEFTVKWEIQVSAVNPKAAAIEALAIMQDTHSTATQFKVKDRSGNEVEIDLED